MIKLFNSGFKGGVHPPEYKKFTDSKPIEVIPLPEKVIIPLQQHLGKPSNVIVNKGDKVKAGDPVSEAGGYVSVPCHSSISGTVTSIQPHVHPLGEKITAVSIESDSENHFSDNISFNADYMNYSVDEMKNLIHDSGIAGMGGATFPTHVKLSPPEGKKMNTAILNGAECEPYLTSDHRLMLEKN